MLRALLLLASPSGAADLRSLGLIDILPDEFPLWRRLPDVALANGPRGDMTAIPDEHDEPPNGDFGKRITLAPTRETRAAIECEHQQ